MSDELRNQIMELIQEMGNAPKSLCTAFLSIARLQRSEGYNQAIDERRYQWRKNRAQYPRGQNGHASQDVLRRDIYISGSSSESDQIHTSTSQDGLKTPAKKWRRKKERVAPDYSPEFEAAWSVSLEHHVSPIGEKFTAWNAWLAHGKPDWANVWKSYIATLGHDGKNKHVSTWLNARGWEGTYKPAAQRPSDRLPDGTKRDPYRQVVWNGSQLVEVKK